MKEKFKGSFLTPVPQQRCIFTDINDSADSVLSVLILLVLSLPSMFVEVCDNIHVALCILIAQVGVIV